MKGLQIKGHKVGRFSATTSRHNSFRAPWDNVLQSCFDGSENVAPNSAIGVKYGGDLVTVEATAYFSHQFHTHQTIK